MQPRGEALTFEDGKVTLVGKNTRSLINSSNSSSLIYKLTVSWSFISCAIQNSK